MKQSSLRRVAQRSYLLHEIGPEILRPQSAVADNAPKFGLGDTDITRSSRDVVNVGRADRTSITAKYLFVRRMALTGRVDPADRKVGVDRRPGDEAVLVPAHSGNSPAGMLRSGLFTTVELF